MGFRWVGLAVVGASIGFACGGEIAGPADGAGASALDPADREMEVRPPVIYIEGGAPTQPPPGRPSACAAIPPVLCDFDQTCPPIASVIGAGAKGEYAAGAGPDGSKAYRVRADRSGIGAGFGLPFFDFYAHPGISLESTDACEVVCEANMRVVQATPGTTIVAGSPGELETWSVATSANGYDLRGPNASAAHAVASSSDWFHVRVRLSPRGPASTTELTFTTANGASTTTIVPSPRGAYSVSFGIFDAAGPGEVYFDDLSCSASDPI